MSRYQRVKSGSVYQVKDTKTGRTLPWATTMARRMSFIVKHMNEHAGDDPEDAYSRAVQAWKRREDDEFSRGLPFLSKR